MIKVGEQFKFKPWQDEFSKYRWTKEVYTRFTDTYICSGLVEGSHANEICQYLKFRHLNGLFTGLVNSIFAEPVKEELII